MVWGGVTLDYLSTLGNFMISIETSLSTLRTFLITGTIFVFGVEISGVTLFDDLEKEEPQYMHGDESLTSLGVVYLGGLIAPF